MPWKLCPYCNKQSYSAATHYQIWLCPYCGNDLTEEPENLSPLDELEEDYPE
ncbi:MAG: hypothetical protein M1299_05020 [Firmicutes bacterium]|nr:hypothetical protein [Bacillota bacterium]MCL5039176.1 hypothetical protein [Bacillota bacterium]